MNRIAQRETLLRLADGLALTGEDRAAFLGAAQRRGARSGAAPSNDLPAPDSLPVPLTALLGRDTELSALPQMLRPSTDPSRRSPARLVTLTGPGGVGKTRLALAVARALVPDFADGAAFVALATVQDPARVLSVLASALGRHPKDDRALPAELAAHLRTKHLLIVLDNFEHLVPAAPELATLLERCPHLAVLVTSRAALRLRGERVVPVEPLAVPDPRRLPGPDAVAEFPAVTLFLERMREHRPGFTLNTANASIVAALCARLEGLPLAIELAAAQSRLLSPAALLARLEWRLTVLSGGPRDLPTRQQTMRATIAWSYNLLSTGEQALFRRLAVFAGSCTLGALEALYSATGGVEGEVLECLGALADKSLVRQADVVDGEPRFSMLETIREYGLECLDAGEWVETGRAYALYYLALAEEAEPQITGPRQAAWLARLELDHDNLRGARRWLRERAEPVLGLRLAGALAPFWYVRGYLSEGRECLEGLLEAARDQPGDAEVSAARAKALHGAGLLAGAQGDHTRAIARYEESLTLFRELGDRRGIAEVLSNLGVVAFQRGEPERAVSLHEEALALRRELGEQRGIANSLNNLGVQAQTIGEYQRAATFFAESLDLYRAIGAPRGIAIALSNLGYAAWHQGAYAQAAALTAESLALRRELGDREGIAIALSNLGEIAALQGDLPRAAAMQAEGLALFRELGATWGIVYCLQRLALVGQTSRSCYPAARLSGALAALRATLALPVPQDEHTRVNASLAALRSTLGDTAFDAAWSDGQRLSLDQAVAGALEIPALVTEDAPCN